MEILKMLTELRQEREQIEEAIITLERLAQGRGRRRGRPPAWLTLHKTQAQEEGSPKRRGRPPGSKNKSRSESVA
jgi:hypothetical protein